MKTTATDLIELCQAVLHGGALALQADYLCLLDHTVGLEVHHLHVASRTWRIKTGFDQFPAVTPWLTYNGKPEVVVPSEITFDNGLVTVSYSEPVVGAVVIVGLKKVY